MSETDGWPEHVIQGLDRWVGTPEPLLTVPLPVKHGGCIQFELNHGSHKGTSWVISHGLQSSAAVERIKMCHMYACYYVHF